MTAPDLSVVILSWNTQDLTLACLRSLYAEDPKFSREVIVIDNASHDGSADAIAAEFPAATLIRNEENVGYSGGHNQGAKLASGRYLCTLNSDTEVSPGALDLLIDFLEENPSYGAVAPRLVNLDGSVQTACMHFPGLCTAVVFDTIWSKFPPGRWVDNYYHMRSFDHLHSCDVDQPPGAVFVMKRDEYLERGGLDEALWLFFNDVDLCRTLWKRGRKIRYLAEAAVTHHGGASTSGFQKMVVIWHRNRMAYYRKQYGAWTGPLMRVLVRTRAIEEWVRIGLRQKDPGTRKAERDHLKEAVREILA